MQGCGLYTDNGKEYEIKAGEAVICLDGDEHGICNKEKEELVFMVSNIVCSFYRIFILTMREDCVISGGKGASKYCSVGSEILRR